MLKYIQLNDQMLSVTGELRFIKQSDALGCPAFVLMASILITFVVYGLLEYLKAGNWLERYFGPNACGGYIFVIIISVVILRLLGIFYGPKFFISREGRITARYRRIGPFLSTRVFEKGSYKFLVEKEHHVEIYSTNGPSFGASDAYQMSLIEEKVGKFSLFIVSDCDELKEFEEKFSDFTGIDFDLLRAPEKLTG